MGIMQRNIVSSKRIDAARARVREGTRRFLLPFGIIGKDKSFSQSLAGGDLVEPGILVVQDVQLLVSPDYIFGVEAGDCISLHTLFSDARADFFKDIELAVNLHRLPLLIVAVSADSAEDPVQAAIQMMERVEQASPTLRRRIEQGDMEMEGCIVDPRSRRTEFISRTYFASGMGKNATYNRAVD